MIHFLRSNILKKISSKISCARATQKYPCHPCAPWIKNPCPPCPPWIIQSVLRGLFRVPSVDYSECEISDDSGRLQLYSHLLLELLGLLASNLSEVATR